MTGNSELAESLSTNGADAPQRHRVRSTIEFPYADLGDAEEVAIAIHRGYGLRSTLDQLAGAMGQTTTSGAFRNKVAAARTFGLVETERGTVTLTDLGRKINDDAQTTGARAEAFLTVPLYKAIYDKYRGHLLPPPAALEREMSSLGVSAKQTGNARQVFARSASLANFFAQGNDRLVVPPVGGLPQTKPIESGRPPQPPSGGDDDDLHPFIKGLLKALPEPGDGWPTNERAKWLRTAANIFDLIYEGDDEEIVINWEMGGAAKS